METWNLFLDSYKGYASYLWNTISHPSLYNNYFYSLILVSAFFFLLEVVAPWRGKQSKFRKDFWLDFFYMFFNFFIFWLIIYNAASSVIVDWINNSILSLTGWDVQASNPMNAWPMWGILLVGFVVRDFTQWWTHRLLHKSSRLWEFHKVHHSVEQMGFAAHLRYHWMETVVYRVIEYIPLAFLGIGLYDFFLIHIFTLVVGHYNHSNITVKPQITGGFVGLLLGVVLANGMFDVSLFGEIPILQKILIVAASGGVGAWALAPIMPYLFNSPEMHIWHHVYELPEDRKEGINFGITLAIWDYIFGTARIPYDGRDIRLGFPGIDKFPQTFVGQFVYGLPFIGKKKE